MEDEAWTADRFLQETAATSRETWRLIHQLLITQQSMGLWRDKEEDHHQKTGSKTNTQQLEEFIELARNGMSEGPTPLMPDLSLSPSEPTRESVLDFGPGESSSIEPFENPNKSGSPVQLNQDSTVIDEAIEVIEETSLEMNKDLEILHLQFEPSKVIHCPINIVDVGVASNDMSESVESSMGPIEIIRADFRTSIRFLRIPIGYKESIEISGQCNELVSEFGSILVRFPVAHKVFDKMSNEVSLALGILNKNSSLDLIVFDLDGDKQGMELDESKCFLRQGEVGILIFDPGGEIDGMDCKIGKARAINMDVSYFQFGCSSGIGAILFGLKFIKEDQTSIPYDRGKELQICFWKVPSEYGIGVVKDKGFVFDPGISQGTLQSNQSSSASFGVMWARVCW